MSEAFWRELMDPWFLSTLLLTCAVCFALARGKWQWAPAPQWGWRPRFVLIGGFHWSPTSARLGAEVWVLVLTAPGH